MWPMTTPHPELGFYTLGGAPDSARDIVGEMQQAEQLGLGKAYISERWNIKEAATLSGAAGAVTEHIEIATAATNHPTRHPLITASYASTMHSLTGGRFTLGIGRGVELMWRMFQLPPVTTAQMEDFAGVMKRLWRGETITDHDGPLGQFPMLQLDKRFDLHIPLGLTAFGPNTLALGGRAFDEVVLHTFFTDETLTRCVKTVKDAAEQAGRDPATVKVWSCFATLGDHLDPKLRLKKSVGRLATYLQAYGDLMVRTNDWDPQDLKRFRADEVVSTMPGLIDAVATHEQLEHIAELIPYEWLEPMAAGTPEQCVAKVRGQLDLGADGVILHGATPTELEPIVKAYRAG